MNGPIMQPIISIEEIQELSLSVTTEPRGLSASFFDSFSSIGDDHDIVVPAEKLAMFTEKKSLASIILGGF